MTPILPILNEMRPERQGFAKRIGPPLQTVAAKWLAVPVFTTRKRWRARAISGKDGGHTRQASSPPLRAVVPIASSRIVLAKTKIP